MAKRQAPQSKQTPGANAKMRDVTPPPPLAPRTTRPSPGPRPIKVRALEMGYYDHARRRPGDVFFVKENEFSSRWMEVCDPRTPEKTTTAKEALEQKHDEILASRTPGGGRENDDVAL